MLLDNPKQFEQSFSCGEDSISYKLIIDVFTPHVVDHAHVAMHFTAANFVYNFNPFPSVEFIDRPTALNVLFS